MDRGTTERLYGNYRAQVINNRDEQQFGRVLVWIPDLMQTVNPTIGIWARPANNPLGGRNDQGEPDHHYMGASYIPRKGAWTWVFFEAGNINRPYYFGALDIENTKVLPENQLGTNYQDKWTLFKSHEGRAVVISDDPDDERVEITGQKRKIKEPPTGDTDSVYTIDENMTTILLDERDTLQKLLIRTYKGDFIHIDIDEQKLQIYFKDDVEFKTDGKLFVTAKDDINILSEEGDINVTAELGNINVLAESGDAINIEATVGVINLLSDQGDGINIEARTGAINIKSIQDTKIQSGTQMSLLAATNGYYTTGFDLNHKAGFNLNQDGGSGLNDQSGVSSPGSPAGPADVAQPAEAATPEGGRDT